ncbi:MAG: hypothetical protein WC101_01470 [Candidatus Gracilibacteria bacterium]|nr:hypothetical protein [Candidatus Gracilibacteria bacterium]
MSYRTIIAEAWLYTQQNKKLIYWFGFFPSIFTTAAGVLYLTYQFFAFKKSELFAHSAASHSFLSDVVTFIFNYLSSHAEQRVPLIITAAVLGVIYLLLPTLTQASAIQIIARHRNGQEAGIGDGLKYGLLSYLPLFEYHTFAKTFGLFTIFFEAAFVLRNLGTEIFKVLLPFFLAYMAIGFVLTLLFTYADLYIIIDNEGVMSSIAKSAKIVILHWQKTFLITALMLIIGARIILQIILLIVVPGAVIIGTAYFASAGTLAQIGIAIGVVLGIAALLFAAYLGGIVEIFSYAVWTYTFLELTSEKELSARENTLSARDEVPHHDGMEN